MAKKYTKRSDGLYRCTVSFGYGHNGKLKRKDVYAKTILELEEKVAEIKHEVSSGTYADDRGMTVRKWSELWLSTYKKDIQVLSTI